MDASIGADLPAPIRTHLQGRHGTETEEVLALAREDPSWLEPLVPGLLYLRVEAVWAVRQEMAQTVTDVLARRTRALILDRERTAVAAPRLADLLAAELGWDERERDRQLAEFDRLVEAERRAATAGPRNATGAPTR